MKNTCKFCGQEKKLIKAHISLSGKFKVKMFNDNAIYYLTSKDYNYEYLRKFFISILWRASISSLPDFRDIQLGQYEQKAFEILQDKEVYENLFKIFIFKYPNGKDFNKFIFISKAKFYNSRAYVINMAGYFIIIILNGRNLIFNSKLNPINDLILNNKGFYVVESNELYSQHYLLANKKCKKCGKKDSSPHLHLNCRIKRTLFICGKRI